LFAGYAAFCVWGFLRLRSSGFFCLRLCGFAAPRAESLRLSVERRISFGGYAARGEASPFLKTAIGKPEAFRTGGGKAASKNTKP